MHTWSSPAGNLNLARHPYDTEESTLFAWNGADSLLAGHLADLAGGQAPARPLRLLVINDHFGALACAAVRAGHELRWQSDSFLAAESCRRNLAGNGLSADRVAFLDSLADPECGLWRPDLVLMQLPKSHVMLEFQLAALARGLPAGTPVCAGGMTRDVHLATIALFTKHIGPARTSLAARKARLIHAAMRPGETGEPAAAGGAAGGAAAAWPRDSRLAVSGLPELVVTSHAGVFSAGGHDEGSLFLLRHLADRAGGEQPEAIVDCGCGNGLLALAAARLYPGARLACADESFMAIASARAGFEANGLAGRASFHWTDCLDGLAPASADLVLCNPPFHRLQTQTLAIAGRMFAQARGVLAPGGRLLVVANRHLGYLPGLERLFPQVRVVAENARYRLIEALA